MLRFAPSPNGPLHLGHALSALANERLAAAIGAPLTVRIEDIDVGRTREAFVDGIVADLEWLGIGWSPPMRRQSAHFADYRAALERLRRDGLVYPSFATRREIAAVARDLALPRDPDGAPLFPGDDAVIGEAAAKERRRSGEPAAWRLDMTAALARTGRPTFLAVDAEGGTEHAVATRPEAWGDVVLARKEVATSYHLSVVVDDAAQAITHVVRGHDLYHATAVHRVLQRLLGLPAPLYHHHRLVLAQDGRKLSKSTGAQSLAALREAGWSAARVRATLEDAARSGRDEREPERHRED